MDVELRQNKNKSYNGGRSRFSVIRCVVSPSLAFLGVASPRGAARRRERTQKNCSLHLFRVPFVFFTTPKVDAETQGRGFPFGEINQWV